MGGFTHYQEQSIELKDSLFIERAEWCRRENKSLEQFADALQIASGKKITKKMVDHWLSRDEEQRQIPAAMVPFWRMVTRKLSTREHDSAMKAIETAEYYASRRQA